MLKWFDGGRKHAPTRIKIMAKQAVTAKPEVVPKIKATARVKIVVEVALQQPWSGVESIEHIHAVAGRQAKERVAALISNTNLPDPIRIFEDPVVIVVSYEEGQARI